MKYHEMLEQAEHGIATQRRNAAVLWNQTVASGLVHGAGCSPRLGVDLKSCCKDFFRVLYQGAWEYDEI